MPVANEFQPRVCQCVAPTIEGRTSSSASNCFRPTDSRLLRVPLVELHLRRCRLAIGHVTFPLFRGAQSHGVTVDIVDLIYETAFVPELWKKLLSDLSDTSGSICGTLFLFGDKGSARGVTLDILDDLLAEFLVNPDLRFSTAVVRMCDTKPNSFVEVDDYLTAAEIEQDPARRRLRARGIGAHICTAVPMPTGELAIYVFQKALDAARYEPDAIGRLNSLRPHLARAALVASRLGLERAKGTAAALEALGLAAAVCINGRAVATSHGFDRYPDLFRSGAGDRVMLAHGQANELLQSAFLTSDARTAALSVRSIPIGADTESGPGVLHVIPLRRAARDIFSGGDTILVFTPVTVSELIPSPSVLGGLFDLTPAEAKLAVSLASGQPLKAAADASDIKFKTARSYLEQIFRKTGTNQQSQLVALLKSAGAIR